MNASPSCLACTTTIRSKGSRCSNGKPRYTERCSRLIPKISYPKSGRQVKNSSGSRNFPTVTLMESSHSVAWLTKARLWSLSSHDPMRLERRGDSEQAQSNAWLSNNAAPMQLVLHSKSAGFFFVPGVEIRRHTNAALKCTHTPIRPFLRKIRHQLNHRFTGATNHHRTSCRNNLFHRRGELRFTFSNLPRLRDVTKTRPDQIGQLQSYGWRS